MPITITNALAPLPPAAPQEKQDNITSKACQDEVFYYELMEVTDFRNDVILAEACRCAASGGWRQHTLPCYAVVQPLEAGSRADACPPDIPALSATVELLYAPCQVLPHVLQQVTPTWAAWPHGRNRTPHPQHVA